MRPTKHPFGWVIVIAASGSGCGGYGQQAQRAHSAASPSAATVTVTDYAFDAPDTLHEGWTTLRRIRVDNHTIVLGGDQNGSDSRFSEFASDA